MSLRLFGRGGIGVGLREAQPRSFHDDGSRAHLARGGKQRLRDYPMPAADVPLIPILQGSA